jgi:hypothetical protein
VCTNWGEAAAELSRLAHAASRRNELRTVCDSTFAKESLVKWLQASAERENPQSWIEVLGVDLAAAVAATTFRVPLVGIIIEEPFRLGPYLIAWFSQQDIQKHASHVPEEHRALALRKFQQHYQGKVCVEGSITAVPSRARSFALEAAADVTAGCSSFILRQSI